MKDFETNPRGTMHALHKANARIGELEMERDHLIMAVEEEGLKIGSHGSGLCITDESLVCLKAKWQAEALVRHARGISRDNEPTDMVCVEDVHTMLLDEAQKLCRQAEEREVRK